MKNLICKSFVLVIFVLLSTNFSKAQVYVGGIEQYMDYANVAKNSSGPNNKYSDMNGSPFLNEDFQKGRVKLRNGKIYEGPLRYDIYSDQIEFQTKDEQVYEIRNPETVEKVSIGKHDFICFIKEEGRELDGIYEQVANGDYTLLVKHKVLLKDAVPAKPYVEPKPATFIKKNSEYFVVDTQGKVILVKSKKDLLALGEAPEEVKDFFKRNKTKVGNQDDLVVFVDYLNKK